MITKLLCRRTFTTSIRDALNPQNVGKELKIQGWIKSIRHHKAITFLDIDDGLNHGEQRLQVVFSSPESGLEELNYHSAVQVEGTLQKSEHKGQAVELIGSRIQYLNPVKNEEYPFQPRKRFSDEMLRNFPHFRSKLNDFASMLKVRSAASWAFHDYFRRHDYLQIHTPILTSNDCEGAGEQFLVMPANESIAQSMKKETIEDLKSAYFDKRVFLSVSGQLHLEAVCNGISKVYTFSPAFRAEMGRTRRHLSEFSMIEAEVAFVQDIQQLLDLQEDLVKSCLKSILDTNQADIEYYLKLADLKMKTKAANLDHLHQVLNNKFVCMTYKEAFDILNKNQDKFQVPPDPENGLGKEHELFLVEDYCNHVPVFITEWPKHTKAFYARRLKDDLVSACDLLFPSVGELSGGALREDNYEILKSNIEAQNIQGLDWYLDLRSSGAAPMAGFGLGFERFIQFILKAYNIRDTIPFSRRPHDCKM